MSPVSQLPILATSAIPVELSQLQTLAKVSDSVPTSSGEDIPEVLPWLQRG